MQQHHHHHICSMMTLRLSAAAVLLLNGCSILHAFVPALGPLQHGLEISTRVPCDRRRQNMSSRTGLCTIRLNGSPQRQPQPPPHTGKCYVVSATNLNGDVTASNNNNNNKNNNNNGEDLSNVGTNLVGEEGAGDSTVDRVSHSNDDRKAVGDEGGFGSEKRASVDDELPAPNGSSAERYNFAVSNAATKRNNDAISDRPGTAPKLEDTRVFSKAAYIPWKEERKDASNSDVSAAISVPPSSPLPFALPRLTSEQRFMLDAGERVQYQADMGREGSGFVVVDVKAPSDVVWNCLLDFHAYPHTIPTVRDVQMFTNTHLTKDYRSEKPLAYEDGSVATLKQGVPSVTRASFTLSKFRLKIAAIHKYRPHPLGDYMVFTLDPACTNIVLKSAKGVWHTQTNPDGKGEDYTRVWLLCELKVSRLLPQWITDYAARRAMPRASTWIKPHVEAAANLWLKKRGINGESAN